MNPENFIKTAWELIPAGQGKPRGANLRRAVSTSYYAMFHCLASSCADTLIGGLQAGRGTDAWILTYRALNHGSAKAKCQDEQSLEQFPISIRGFAKTFARLQKQRHRADYAPDARLRKSEAIQSINEAENAIRNFEGESLAERRAFAAYILFKGRTHNVEPT